MGGAEAFCQVEFTLWAAGFRVFQPVFKELREGKRVRTRSRSHDPGDEENRKRSFWISPRHSFGMLEAHEPISPDPGK